MKTYKAIILVLLFSSAANAQITKGNWMVGGTGSLYSTELKDENINDKTIGLELRPNVGYFIANRFAIGMAPLLAYSKSENGSSVTNYGVGPFARYYLLNPEKRINVLTHVGYSYNKSSNSDYKSTSFDIKAGPVVYFNSSVALEILLNYNINKQESTTYNILSLGIGFQIHLEK